MTDTQQIDREVAAEAFRREGAITAASALRQYPDAMTPVERSAITAARLMRERLTAEHESELVALRDEKQMLLGLLQEWQHFAGLQEGDAPCYYDHHGYCQAHFIEEDCLAKRTEKTLKGGA